MNRSSNTSQTLAAAQLRAQTLAALRSHQNAIASQNVLVGFDGFVDEIIRVVDKRDTPKEYTLIGDINTFAQRIAQASGQSTNMEMIVQQTKLGGNGPIFANALAAFGMPVTYIGMLGYPDIHPVFRDFAQRAHVISVAEPGHTDALEFNDGKLMMGKHESLHGFTWELIIQRVGAEKCLAAFQNATLLGLVNWTMYAHMSDIWKHLIHDICPQLATTPRKTIFFDLADPEKRFADDILEALNLITQFQKYFSVILGINEKESHELATVLSLPAPDDSPAALQALAQSIRARLQLECVVIHPRTYAVAATANETAYVQGPFTAKPLISTGAGDHFNAGFSLGFVSGLPLASCLLLGVSTSGFYVRTGKSPRVEDLVMFIMNWPEECL
ncbi:MAG: PfkB family carbohydrate kinase [candidate division KSB1 bacterium]